MVNPGGTGKPSLAISARFDPLPPKIFLELDIFLVFLSPKLNINFDIKFPLILRNLQNY